MGTKKPRFFCDNCGAEVAMAAKSCPRCGRFFASVRCPHCGFTGKDEDFSRGCPACGYSISPGGEGSEGAFTGAANPSGKRGVQRPWESGRGAPREPAFPLPVWLYLVAALALISVLALLYNVLR
jgi:predicted RNA-binding Zn-ribbon protein involved in translation (DUF1610 family)